MFKIIRKGKLTDQIFLSEIEVPSFAPDIQPGHHVDVQVDAAGGSFTLPVSRYDREKNTITVIYENLNPDFQRMSELGESNEIYRVDGPLGAACKIDRLNKVLFAAEDLGVASLYCRARKYKEKGAYSICVLGFETKNDVYWEEDFLSVCDELYVCTRDGSYGVNGMITNPVRAVCETHKNVERIIMIGQLDKMKKVAKVAADFDVTALMSFDAIKQSAGKPGIFDAGDAGSALQEAFNFAKAPEIDANDIDFDKLLARQRALLKESEKPPATP